MLRPTALMKSSCARLRTAQVKCVFVSISWLRFDYRFALIAPVIYRPVGHGMRGASPRSVKVPKQHLRTQPSRYCNLFKSELLAGRCTVAKAISRHGCVPIQKDVMTNPSTAPDQQTFPVLNVPQIAKLRPLVTTRRTHTDEVLIESGDHVPGLFVVLEGADHDRRLCQRRSGNQNKRSRRVQRRAWYAYRSTRVRRLHRHRAWAHQKRRGEENSDVEFLCGRLAVRKEC